MREMQSFSEPGDQARDKVSAELEAWLASDHPKTLGNLIGLFDEKSFALVFMLLMAVPALPLPTGGATHVLEVITVLVALQLVVGREEIWLPERWKGIELAGPRRERLLRGLLRLIRFFERFSKPRLRWLLDPKLGRSVLGVVVIALTVAAFVAPPFSGLDTLPSLGVVVLSLGVLLEDFIVALIGVAIGVAGVALEVALGSAVLSLFE
jgi:hypothetical protein